MLADLPKFVMEIANDEGPGAGFNSVGAKMIARLAACIAFTPSLSVTLLRMKQPVELKKTK